MIRDAEDLYPHTWGRIFLAGGDTYVEVHVADAINLVQTLESSATLPKIIATRDIDGLPVHIPTDKIGMIGFMTLDSITKCWERERALDELKKQTIPGWDDD